jgi:glyoxylase-like metal-dependent hydrolase (beta-lactamase superfamily II)
MLHILRLPIVNVYLLLGERAVLVDAGGPTDVPRIISFLARHGVADLALILLTHGHWDHAGGAAELRTRTKAPIAVQRDDVDLVCSGSGSNGPAKPTCLTAYFVKAFVNRDYPPFEPDVVIDDELDLATFSVAGRVIRTPGHTPGSISVLTPDSEAIVGDLIMGGWFGGNLFPTRPGLHYFVEDPGLLKESIAKVLNRNPNVILPGHGGPLDPASIRRFIS